MIPGFEDLQQHSAGTRQNQRQARQQTHAASPVKGHVQEKGRRARSRDAKGINDGIPAELLWPGRRCDSSCRPQDNSHPAPSCRRTRRWTRPVARQSFRSSFPRVQDNNSRSYLTITKTIKLDSISTRQLQQISRPTLT